MIKVILEALDDEVITKRTGKTKALGGIKKLPENGDYLTVVFDESENTESPGVCTEINNLEQIDKEYKYYDYDDRPFKITLVN